MALEPCLTLMHPVLESDPNVTRDRPLGECPVRCTQERLPVAVRLPAADSFCAGCGWLEGRPILCT